MQCGQRAQFPGFKGGPGRKPLSTQRTVFNQEFYFKKESTPYVCFWILRHHCMHGLGVKNEKLAFPLQNFMKTEFSCMILILDSAPPLHSRSLAQICRIMFPLQKLMQPKFSSGQNKHLCRCYSLSKKWEVKSFKRRIFSDRDFHFLYIQILNLKKNQCLLRLAALYKKIGEYVKLEG